MLNYVNDFLELEKKKPNIVLKEFSNGIEYIYKKYIRFNYLHSFYYPLNDSQIKKLESDVNVAQSAHYIFPDWYIEFLKTTNGLNIFFNSIIFYGEQTPMINHPKYGYVEAPIERDNPEWMAPFNLRYPRNSIRYDAAAQERWLIIGSYHADGTIIAWDYTLNKIVLMYSLPVTLSIKKLKHLSELDYQDLIFKSYDSFEEFFHGETFRLNVVFDKYLDKNELDQTDVLFWRKTLPIGHKNHMSENI